MNRPVLQSGKLPVCKDSFLLEPDEMFFGCIDEKTGHVFPTK